MDRSGQETVNEWPRAVRSADLFTDFVDARADEGRAEGIGELAAQIAAKGLLQPIVVRPVNDHGKFDIIAGKRRYLAIRKLIESGDWPKDRLIPVTVRDENDREAFESSLIENIGRLPMHPVSQYEAFAHLADQGMGAADIAARFGLAERTVRQRLALGGLHPEIREAWRKGDGVDAQAAEAFTLAADPKLQVKVFRELKNRNWSGRVFAFHVKEALLNDRPQLDDPLVRLVGLERYREAGGEVAESLFDDFGYVADGALLKRLARERLEETCERLKQEGWAWAELADDMPPEWRGWDRKHPPKKYTAAEEKRLMAIEKRFGEIRDEEDAAEEAEKLDELEDEEIRLDAERDRIEEAAFARGFPKAMRKECGCAVAVGDDGALITYGVIKPGGAVTMRKVGNAKTSPPGEAEGRNEESSAPAISNALLLSLTELRTKAAAEALAADFELALRCAVAALTSMPFGPVKLSENGFLTPSGLRDHDFDERLKALDGTNREGLEAAFARLIGEALDLRRHHADAPGAQADALVGVLHGPLYTNYARKLFDPEDFFKRAPMAMAHAALEEMGIDSNDLPPHAKKKAELAAYAAEKARECGWLPAELRHPEYQMTEVRGQRADD